MSFFNVTFKVIGLSGLLAIVPLVAKANKTAQKSATEIYSAAKKINLEDTFEYTANKINSMSDTTSKSIKPFYEVNGPLQLPLSRQNASSVSSTNTELRDKNLSRPAAGGGAKEIGERLVKHQIEYYENQEATWKEAKRNLKQSKKLSPLEKAQQRANKVKAAYEKKLAKMKGGN